MGKLEVLLATGISTEYFHELISANNLPNLLLFFAGLGGIAVGVYTLKDIRRQTELLGQYVKATNDGVEATRKSADAALLNAQAMINSERPWMLIEVKAGNSQGTFTVSFRNCGRTPAEVVSFCQHLECRKRDNDFGLPASPDYWDEAQLFKYTRMVAPQGVWFNPNDSYFVIDQNVTTEQWRDITNSRQRAVYWGRLRYRDMIEFPKTAHQLTTEEAVSLPRVIHETCFCYWWSPALNDLPVGGPLAYNKNT
jgi:hypothetical protein